MNKYIFYVAQESVFHHFKASHIHSDQSWWNDIHINIKKILHCFELFFEREICSCKCLVTFLLKSKTYTLVNIKQHE